MMRSLLLLLTIFATGTDGSTMCQVNYNSTVTISDGTNMKVTFALCKGWPKDGNLNIVPPGGYSISEDATASGSVTGGLSVLVDDGNITIRRDGTGDAIEANSDGHAVEIEITGVIEAPEPMAPYRGNFTDFTRTIIRQRPPPPPTTWKSRAECAEGSGSWPPPPTTCSASTCTSNSTSTCACWYVNWASDSPHWTAQKDPRFTKADGVVSLPLNMFDKDATGSSFNQFFLGRSVQVYSAINDYNDTIELICKAGWTEEGVRTLQAGFADGGAGGSNVGPVVTCGCSVYHVFDGSKDGEPVPDYGQCCFQ